MSDSSPTATAVGALLLGIYGLVFNLIVMATGGSPF